jgi:hypothetical protein
MKQKVDGVEIFRRGVKTEWQKMACSDEPKKTLAEVQEWGATPAFEQVIRAGKWKDGMFGILDTAIDRYGITKVRKPAIRVGTCHSVKGLQAEIVFCLATSTAKAAEEEIEESLCLRYVTITRTSRHYRLIVDQMDVARGKPLFWAAPAGIPWKFDQEMEFIDECRKKHSGEDPEVAWLAGDLGGEVRGLGDESQGHPGHSLLREREADRNGSEEARDAAGEDSGAREAANLEEWWNL